MHKIFLITVEASTLYLLDIHAFDLMRQWLYSLPRKAMVDYGSSYEIANIFSPKSEGRLKPYCIWNNIWAPLVSICQCGFILNFFMVPSSIYACGNYKERASENDKEMPPTHGTA